MVRQDSWLLAGEAWRHNRRRALMWALDLLFFVATSLMFYHMAQLDFCDMKIHSEIAADFDFTDLHSITSRLAYPLWHLFVSSLYQLGLPLAVSAAVVTGLFKTLGLVVAQCLLCPPDASGRERVLAWFTGVLMMFVTGVRIASVNPTVYRHAGSPNVWHNPTQVTVTAILLLCVPYIIHCYRLYENARDDNRLAELPWKNTFVLAILLGLCAAAKPTSLQALLPAAFVLFAVEWARRPKQWRYFVRLALAFVPAAGYFLLQYLYYTGVVVEYTSGVEISLTFETLWTQLRGLLIMCAFPLGALLCRRLSGKRFDSETALVFLIAGFSVLEAATFHETGLRINHGNFTWAMGNAALLMWWLALRGFARDIAEAWRNRRAPLIVGYALCSGLLIWHIASAVYYVYFLIDANSAF